MTGVPVSGAQYGGDALMKFRGGDARPMGAGPEAFEEWETTEGVEVVRMGHPPLAEMVEASGTGFRGKLVS